MEMGQIIMLLVLISIIALIAGLAVLADRLTAHWRTVVSGGSILEADLMPNWWYRVPKWYRNMARSYAVSLCPDLYRQYRARLSTAFTDKGYYR